MAKGGGFYALIARAAAKGKEAIDWVQRVWERGTSRNSRRAFFFPRGKEEGSGGRSRIKREIKYSRTSIDARKVRTLDQFAREGSGRRGGKKKAAEDISQTKKKGVAKRF